MVENLKPGEVKRIGLSIEKMQGILRIIRRDAPQTILNNPNDKPKIIEDLQLASDGSVRTYIEGEPYPLRFFTPHEAVDVVANYKRLFALLLEKGLLGFVIIWLGRKIWPIWIHRIFELYPVLLKDEHYSQPVKELRRVLNIDPNIKDAISLVLENDMAYRYRFQDIIGELNKDTLKVFPTTEIKRLLSIMRMRETDPRIKKKVELIIRFAFLLRFTPFIKILKDINIDEVKLSVEDKYWVKLNKSYNFGGNNI
jgi:hypothetical protein